MTTDFEAWLDAADVEGHEEIDMLIYAIRNRESCGLFSVSTSGDKTFIRGGAMGDDNRLELLSEKARVAFLDYAEKRLNPDPDMSIDGSIAFRRAMAKDD